MAPSLLDDATVDQWLGEHGAWSRSGDVISRIVECASFPAAIELVCRVADVAEARDHHPDIDVRWRTLRFELSTHSAGGLTHNDLEVAEQIDRLAAH
jgi:4a-hydroxytetrahydrobiopterin dehydratase